MESEKVGESQFETPLIRSSMRIKKISVLVSDKVIFVIRQKKLGIIMIPTIRILSMT